MLVLVLLVLPQPQLHSKKKGKKELTEVVRISGRRGQHDDNGNDPVLKQTHERGIERPITSPDARKGQDALAPELLHQPALRKNHTQDIAKSRQRDKDTEGTLGARPKDVAEKGAREDAAGAQNLLLWHGGEVGNVGQHVQDADNGNGGGSGDFQRAHRVLHLRHCVVCVAVADVAPDDVVEGGDDAVGAAGGAVEGAVEVVGLVDLEVAAQGREARDDDDEEDDELDDAEGVLQPQAPFQGEAVDQEGGGDAGEADAALVPAVDGDLGGVEDVFAKDDAVGACPAEQHDVAGVEARDEEAGLLEDVLEVVLLAAVAREAGAEFKVDCHSGGGDEHAGHPDEEGQADAATERVDCARC